MAFTVTYNANGATGGTVPTDGNSYSAGAKAKVLGNSGGLVKGSQTFAYWNTAADDSGQVWLPGFNITMTGNIALFAQWRTTSGLAAGGSTTHYDVSYDASLPTARGQTASRSRISALSVLPPQRNPAQSDR
jgi:Listeria-Bacteroides repeat domain (List_Bact_rpt)